jgi:hypothetical protein
MKYLVFVSLLILLFLGSGMSAARAATTRGPVSGRWTMAPSMPVPLMSHQAVLLHDGRVLVLGGESVLGVPTPTAQLYDPSTHVWSTEATMHVARIGFTASVLYDGRVLVVGGIGTNMNDLAAAEVFDPRTGSWTVLPALPQPRFSQSASLLPDGRFSWWADSCRGASLARRSCSTRSTACLCQAHRRTSHMPSRVHSPSATASFSSPGVWW